MNKLSCRIAVLLCFLTSTAWSLPAAEAHLEVVGPTACTWTYHDELTGQTRCFHLVTELETFFIAESRCVLQYSGHLATPDTENKDTFLRMKLVELYGNDEARHLLWFGAYRTGTWGYTSGETFDFTNWMEGQPNLDGDVCAAYHEYIASGSYFEWADKPCGQEFWFICEEDEAN